MNEYQKRCPIDGGTCGLGGTCYVCENEALGSELTAAKAHIAEAAKLIEAADSKAFCAMQNCCDGEARQLLIHDVRDDLRRAAALLKDK